MKVTKFISVTALTLLTLVVVIAILVVALMKTEASVSMERLRQPLIDAISQSTGRDVKIDGELRLTLSLFPALLVKGIHIYNEPGWKSEEIVSLDEANIEISLVSLLNRELVFKELSAKQAEINLEQDSQGNINWVASKSQPQTRSEPDHAGQPTSGSSLNDRITFEHIRLNNITLNYRDDATGFELTDHVDTLHIITHDRSRLEAEVAGTVNDIPYSLNTTSDLLRHFPANKPWKLDMEGEIAGSPVSVSTELESIDGLLRGYIDLQATDLDAARLFDVLGVDGGLGLHANKMHLTTDFEGTNLQELIKKSSFDVNLIEGAAKLKSHIDQRFQDISFEKASVSVRPDQDMKLDFTGLIGNNPVELSIQTNPPADFLADLDEVRFVLDANLTRATLNLDGTLKLPASSKTLEMNIDVSGERLDQWNSVLINDLPPIGPYQLYGQLSLTPDGYHVKNFNSKIANSDLSGSVDIDINKPRPVWEMELVSNQLQLNDFDVEGYTLVPSKEIIKQPASDSASITDEYNEKTAKDKERELSVMVDQRLGETREIDHWDIDLTVDSRNILSGADRLGSGTIALSARETSIDVDTHLNTIGGQIDSDMGLHLVKNGVSGHLKLDMDKFDYGIFLRRMDPESDADGLLSTRVDLKYAGKDFSRRFDNASGEIDFALWPQNISAGDIDIWAFNLFQAVSSSVTTTDSRLNCIVGIIDLDNGQLNEEFLAIDTTKVWLYGNLDIHYPSESIELKLLPRAKKPKIAGIETPVFLKGKLTDNFDTSDLEIDKKDIAATITSIIFSPLHVPMRRIYGRKVPEDNSEMCGKLLDRSYLKSIKATIEESEITWDDVYSGN